MMNSLQSLQLSQTLHHLNLSKSQGQSSLKSSLFMQKPHIRPNSLPRKRSSSRNLQKNNLRRNKQVLKRKLSNSLSEKLIKPKCSKSLKLNISSLLPGSRLLSLVKLKCMSLKYPGSNHNQGLVSSSHRKRLSSMHHKRLSPSLKIQKIHLRNRRNSINSHSGTVMGHYQQLFQILIRRRTKRYRLLIKPGSMPTLILSSNMT